MMIRPIRAPRGMESQYSWPNRTPQKRWKNENSGGNINICGMKAR